jgi:hypothetical protein
MRKTIPKEITRPRFGINAATETKIEKIIGAFLKFFSQGFINEIVMIKKSKRDGQVFANSVEEYIYDSKN